MQLLAVLPVASKNLLPFAYRKLMTSKKSPIHHYYPETYKTDANGKKSSWEAVVLIPFIDEVNFLNIIFFSLHRYIFLLIVLFFSNKAIPR